MANIEIFKNERIGETRAIFDEIYKEIYGDERNGPWSCIVDNMRPIDLHTLKYNEGMVGNQNKVKLRLKVDGSLVMR